MLVSPQVLQLDMRASTAMAMRASTPMAMDSLLVSKLVIILEEAEELTPHVQPPTKPT